MGWKLLILIWLPNFKFHYYGVSLILHYFLNFEPCTLHAQGRAPFQTPGAGGAE